MHITAPYFTAASLFSPVFLLCLSSLVFSFFTCPFIVSRQLARLLIVIMVVAVVEVVVVVCNTTAYDDSLLLVQWKKCLSVCLYFFLPGFALSVCALSCRFRLLSAGQFHWRASVRLFACFLFQCCRFSFSLRGCDAVSAVIHWPVTSKVSPYHHHHHHHQHYQ